MGRSGWLKVIVPFCLLLYMVPCLNSVILLTFGDICIQFGVQKKQETYRDEVIHK